MATFDYSRKKPSSSDRATGLTANLSGYRKSPPPRAVSPIEKACLTINANGNVDIRA